jgi:phosphatidylethanolamine/phosphatidyl-N-methylethanolamine N-methyltransferase
MNDRAYWERHARRYDASLRLVLGGPIPRMLELTSEAVRGCGRVLEVAAGTGLVTTAIARSAKTVIATDYANSMVEILNKRVTETGLSNVTCEQADLYTLRFGQAEFDAVVAANVLHLVPDLAGALAAFRHVLKPGGRLIVPTFCHDETVVSRTISRALAITGFPAQRRFSAKSLRAAMQLADLRVSHFETLPGVIPIGYAEGTFEMAANQTT